ncbi:MAG TPA: class I SAM-dependent methyltransferase [Planctomycetota bacterium]|nr:class I SAM-dependent methyltransferase [Planctomycetota bacterium]
MVAPTRFDAAYYARFYGDRRTRVADAASTRRLGEFVCAYLRFLGLPVREVVDLGCGLGHWRAVIAAQFPRARYTGVEVSDYLCRRYGWQKGSAVDYRHPRPADLVICQGVLQYLDARQARAAIDNLARLTRGALYLEVLTRTDWEENCDRSVTDGAVHLRTGAFYRRLLRRHFHACGGGLFVRRDAGVVLFELEHAG